MHQDELLFLYAAYIHVCTYHINWYPNTMLPVQ
jgi:hypothetical protein